MADQNGKFVSAGGSMPGNGGGPDELICFPVCYGNGADEGRREERMGFLRRLMGGTRSPSIEQVQAVLTPLGDRICDFKDSTKISWTVLLPAALSVGSKMMVSTRGQQATETFLVSELRKLEAESNVPSSAIAAQTVPEARAEHISQVNQFLMEAVGSFTASGTSPNIIADALTRFASLAAKTSSGAIYTQGLIKKAIQDIQKYPI